MQGARLSRRDLYQQVVLPDELGTRKAIGTMRAQLQYADVLIARQAAAIGQRDVTEDFETGLSQCLVARRDGQIDVARYPVRNCLGEKQRHCTLQ
ncbi:hypothetical protein D9M72_539600 [compost metagenome]